jgi:hypothetical protein
MTKNNSTNKPKRFMNVSWGMPMIVIVVMVMMAAYIVVMIRKAKRNASVTKRKVLETAITIENGKRIAIRESGLGVPATSDIGVVLGKIVEVVVAAAA